MVEEPTSTASLATLILQTDSSEENELSLPALKALKKYITHNPNEFVSKFLSFFYLPHQHPPPLELNPLQFIKLQKLSLLNISSFPQNKDDFWINLSEENKQKLKEFVIERLRIDNNWKKYKKLTKYIYNQILYTDNLEDWVEFNQLIIQLIMEEEEKGFILLLIMVKENTGSQIIEHNFVKLYGILEKAMDNEDNLQLKYYSFAILCEILREVDETNEDIFKPKAKFKHLKLIYSFTKCEKKKV